MEAKESLDIQTCSGSLPDSTTPKLRPAVHNLSDEAKLLAQRLLRCLALDLKIDPQSFLRAHAGMLTGMFYVRTPLVESWTFEHLITELLKTPELLTTENELSKLMISVLDN